MKRVSSLLILMLLSACAARVVTTDVIAEPPGGLERPDIIATNAFYYYHDVDAAWTFYRDVLGFDTVVDYGFAKIVRVAESSYLTLVQASEGMHSADEPKTVTLSLVSDELSVWHEHLSNSGVQLHPGSVMAEGSVGNSFVVVDPEGYLLKFIRYNPHPNHDAYLAGIAAASPTSVVANGSLAPRSIRAAAYTAYFSDTETVRPFYEDLFAVQPAGEIEGAAAYQLSASGFLILEDGSDGLHQATEKSGVTFSFFTNCVDAWYARARSQPGFELRTPEVLDEGGLVRVFVGYDPRGTFLEWDTFQIVPENEALHDNLEFAVCAY